MRSNKKTTAIVLAGAVGLSSVAYGIGSQAGDGSSSAAAAGNKTGVQRGMAPPGFGGRDCSGPGQARPFAHDLATELGVDADALQDALRDFHESGHADMRSAFTAALADALGKSKEDVQSALDSLESERHARFAAQLAEALNIDAAAVATALEELEDERPGKPGEPGDFAAALAKKLGLEADAVEAALMDPRPDRGAGRRGQHHAVPLRQLSAELDVSRGELRKALREVRPGNGFDGQGRREELVKFLAKRFELSEEKVEHALPVFTGRGPGGPGPGPGLHGPGGPGRPGGGPPGMP